MKILVLNAGSSSLKYQLIDMETEQWIAKGNCEKIKLESSLITHKTRTYNSGAVETVFADHREAFLAVMERLTTGEGKVLDSYDEIFAVGHRVLHGAERYKKPTLITDRVIDDIEDMAELGPLHMIPQANTMRACREVFGDSKPMVAVFDTSFHQTMPPKAYMFAVPYKYYEKYSIRRYGFHGISHNYVSDRYFEMTGTPRDGSRIVVCHLGNGSSITAVKDGKVADTSMGFTPLDGLIMGTRCGGIDPSVVTYIANKEHKTPDEMSDLMNKKSGFLGISGVSSDCRDLREACARGDERADLALEMLAYQIKKLVGGYAAAMGGLDAIIFTGGIGENDHMVRLDVLKNMEFLGVNVDHEVNEVTRGTEAVISTADSRVKAYVIPTNEEIMIARETLRLSK